MLLTAQEDKRSEGMNTKIQAEKHHRCTACH